MRPSEEIYLWYCNSKISRSHYDTEGKAFKACVRKFRLPQCFGLPRYIQDSNEVLLKEIKSKLDQALTDECKDNAKAGVYRDQKVLDFVDDLKKLMEKY